MAINKPAEKEARTRRRELSKKTVHIHQTSRHAKAYTIQTVTENTQNHVKEIKDQGKMRLECHSCGKSFDSTFTVEDFGSLPLEQYEAGTLHLCPYCGDLGIYQLKDYKEPS